MFNKSKLGKIIDSNDENKPPNVAYCEESNFFYDFNSGTYYNLALSEDQNLIDDYWKP